MHNNYFFLRKLVSELHEVLRGAELVECLSQAKEELIIGFCLANKSDFYIKADLNSSFSCLSFPESFVKSKRGAANLFKELIGLQVMETVVYDNERAFRITFTNGFSLVFKLFGNRSNALVYHYDEAVKCFNRQFVNDLEVSLQGWNKTLLITSEEYLNQKETLYKLVPTLGKELADQLMQQNLTFDDFTTRLNTLGSDGVFVYEAGERPALLLFERGEGYRWFRSAIEGITQFYNSYIRIESFERTKKRLLQNCLSRQNQQAKRLLKLEARLNDLLEEQPLNQIADVVMANLHAIDKGQLSVELFDFHTNKTLQIEFKRDQKPQDYAAQLYRKSKNRSIELESLEGTIAFIQNDLLELKTLQATLQEVDSFRDLKKYIKEEKQAEAKEEEPKFKTFHFEGFEIIVGRNSRNNDEVTKSARKDDLWLHAKDVSGSHVIIKQQAGKPFPKSVIHYAATLAAGFSKRKTDSLCPVMVTPKKYVRKIKGAPAGSVMVDREEVLLVKPYEGK